MNITIIGAGNMGSAIACGLYAANASTITVTNRSEGKLEALKAKLPGIAITTDNKAAASGADVIIIAVKPDTVKSVAEEIAPCLEDKRQQIVSIAAGVTTGKIQEYLWGRSIPIYYLIPNIAIRVGESMTFVSAINSSAAKLKVVTDLFANLGEVMVIDEKQIPACTALASCGIAYVLRYIRASMEAAIQLGISAPDSLRIIEQTIIGAATVLRKDNSHPEREVDNVTTPGGLTIRGLNAMEENGFSNAVIKGLLASVSK
jgi:pyrroline-5-carboxylate reductase